MIIETPTAQVPEVTEDSNDFFLRPKPGIEGLQGSLEQVPREKLKKNPLRQVLAPAPRSNPADRGTALTDEELQKLIPTYEPWQR